MNLPQRLSPSPSSATLPTATGGDASPLVSQARHDLRNSAGQILGFSEMLLEQAQALGHAQLIAGLTQLTQMACQIIARFNEGLNSHKTQAGQGDFAQLRSQLRLQTAQIINLTAGLLQEAQAFPEDLFSDDLSRIAGAAGELLKLIQNSVSAIIEPPAKLPTPPGPRPGPDPSTAALLEAATTAVASSKQKATILVVDDQAENRELLRRRLSGLGYSVALVEDGRKALEFVAAHEIDLVLLDILMPELDGIQTLRALKDDPATQHIPVIMLSSASQIATAARCIELGADDFLPKPFNSVLLMARIASSMSKKRLHDQEQELLKRLRAEQELSERLLLNILPRSIAERLKLGEPVIADSFSEASVLFTDFVGFTKMSAHISPKELVGTLNLIFSTFDGLCDHHGLEKIKMIGDAYMVVGGLPNARDDHAEATAELALAMQREVAKFKAGTGMPFRMRIGINTGPVVAGVIGTKKFAYDLWGDTVNVASHMESCAPPGGILVSSATHACLHDKFAFTPARLVRVKGRGEMLTYLLKKKVTFDN